MQMSTRDRGRTSRLLNGELCGVSDFVSDFSGGRCSFASVALSVSRASQDGAKRSGREIEERAEQTVEEGERDNEGRTVRDERKTAAVAAAIDSEEIEHEREGARDSRPSFDTAAIWEGGRLRSLSGKAL